MNEPVYVPHLYGEAVTAKYSHNLGWLTASIKHSIPWPEFDVMVTYDGTDFFLRGLTQEGKNAPACISLSCADGQSNIALHKLYRFVSILGWVKRGYVDVMSHVTSSHAIRYSEAETSQVRYIAGGSQGFRCNYMPLVRDENTRIALAFWREGLRLERVHSGYAFLSFYKVIESQFDDGRPRGDWIEKSIPLLANDAEKRVQELLALNISVGTHLFKSGRCAVAHASLSGEVVDPDIPEDRTRLTKDLVVIRALAQKYIKEVLGVPDEMDIYKSRNRFIPLYSLLDPEHIQILRSGGWVSRRKIALDRMRISVNKWGSNPPEAFTNLKLSVKAIKNGFVEVEATNSSRTITLGYIFDFNKERLHANLDTTDYRSKKMGCKLDDSIAVVEYRKAVLGNGLIEFLLPNSLKVDCEVVFPVNVDIGATFKAWDREIEELRKIYAD